MLALLFSLLFYRQFQWHCRDFKLYLSLDRRLGLKREDAPVVFRPPLNFIDKVAVEA